MAIARVEATIASKPEASGGLLTVSNIGYSYPNGLKVLDDVSLTCRPGRVTAIVGPSGCGKSTLLKLVTALLKPSRGTVTTTFAPSPDRPPMVMLFQQDTLLPWLKVKENVGLYFRFHRGAASREAVDARIAELLELVKLESFASSYPRQLSGGMRRRVAFLSAVAPYPQLLLLDEPFASVDEPTRIQIHQQVRRIIRSIGIGALLVTHDLAEAITLADEVVILTNRPARIATFETTTALGDERDLLEIRDTEPFLRLYGRLWRALGQQIKGQPAG